MKTLAFQYIVFYNSRFLLYIICILYIIQVKYISRCLLHLIFILLRNILIPLFIMSISLLDLQYSKPVVRDCNQLERIQYCSLIRDELAMASVLLEDDNNYVVIEKDDDNDNATRNLAQIGLHNKITVKKGRDFVNFHDGQTNLRRIFYETMKEAKDAVNQYHLVYVTWDEPRRNTHPRETIQDAFHNLHFCKFFSRNACYCKHILVVCHKKGIIDFVGELRNLQPVRKAGRPKKMHFLQKLNPSDSEPQVPKSVNPSSLFGQSIFDDAKDTVKLLVIVLATPSSRLNFLDH